jgi:hypothetical protein
MYVAGIDPNQVWDSLDASGFGLGQRGADHLGNEFIFLVADEAITASAVLIIQTDGGVEMLDTTSGAAGTGTGKPLAVAPAAPSQTIASGDFFWGCVRSLSYVTKGIDSAAAFVELYATTTPGAVDDVFDGDQCVRGIVFVTTLSGVTVEEAMITYPTLVNSIDS